MVKLKEEFDYKSLCRRLDIELDKLIAENERQRKYFDDEIERITTEAQCRIAEAERECKIALEVCFHYNVHLLLLYIDANQTWGTVELHELLQMDCVSHTFLPFC
jgi:hypothetical protein